MGESYSASMCYHAPKNRWTNGWLLLVGHMAFPLLSTLWYNVHILILG
jgi:hypothetical protein